MNERVKTIVSLLAVVVWCGFIFYMSAFPADESTDMSMGIVYQVVQLLIPGFEHMPPIDQAAVLDQFDHIVRKLAHFSEYAVLGALALNFARRIGATRNKLQYVVIWAFCTLYAAGDEFHQMFVPGRSCQFTDVCIDSAGIVAGMLLFAAFHHLATRKRIIGDSPLL